MDITTSLTSEWSTNTAYTPSYNTDIPAWMNNGIDPMRFYFIIFKYVAPVLILMGTIGNIISVVVLQSRFFRRAPSAFILSALSLTDTGVLLCGLMRHWIKALTQNKLNIRNLSQASCPVHFFFTYFLPQLSSWSLALLTVERMSSVRWPFKAKELFSKPRMISIWVVTAIILAIINAQAFKTMILQPFTSTFDNTTVEYSCYRREESKYFFHFVWPWMDFFLISLLPMVIMGSCNVVIVMMLLKSRRMRKGQMQASCATDESAAITAMLIGASVLFFLATTPSSIYFIVLHYWPPKTSAQKYVVNTAYSLVNIIYYLSNSLNFMVYCLSGSKFRRAFVAVLFCRDPKPQGSSVTSKYSLSTIEGTKAKSSSLPE
ncbi:hypothetical protein LSH36_316g01007 [Paralvinella palmiformis]|uniref:G-protein coupled receptors family 1 profile domain-containing protein n=1 Tax=Paralvinella palmiformis TaxID=53620 RepID=A0AAD9JHN5_9ANNE|nr:hypothetical protein LSH36_316g01007 [Paralvinella palmiformis]